MASHIGRRKFLATLGGAAAWPLAARAQQAGKQPTIGFLGSTTPLVESQRVAAFVQRLRQLGWIEGHNLAIEYRWAEGRNERFAEIAPEFVRLKVDLIVTLGTVAVLAAKQATSVIPIVFAGASDPIGSGLVASLAQPGGNVTGLSGQVVDTASKASNFCGKFSPVCAGWRSWPMSPILASWRTCARFKRRPAWSASKPLPSKSGTPRRSRPSSKRSRTVWMHFMSRPTRS